MKLYDTTALPNPRRVRMFLAEKQITVPMLQVNVPEGEHREPDFLRKNPDATVPLLELDDGKYISETVAISRYFEEKQPHPPLMGTNPDDKAIIEMWQRRVEHSLMNRLITYFHHATPGFGEKDRYRNKEWGEHNRSMAIEALKQLDKQLENDSYITGNTFTIADITAFCAVDLAKAIGIEIPASCNHLKSWYEAVSKRKSAAA